MEDFNLIVSHILQNTNDNNVTALQSYVPFSVCVSSNKPTSLISRQVETRSETDACNSLLNLSKLKGKELEDLLRKYKLKISGKVDEKRERLNEYLSNL